MTWLGLLLLKINKDKTNRSIVFLYYVFNCIKALNVMTLDIEMCIFIMESNLGLEIRKEQNDHKSFIFWIWKLVDRRVMRISSIFNPSPSSSQDFSLNFLSVTLANSRIIQHFGSNSVLNIYFYKIFKW